MKQPKPRFCLIVCEGDSEEAYVQELAVFARDHEWGITFQAKRSEGGGEFSALVKACKKTNHTQTKVMVDWDRFERNEGKCRDHYEAMRARLPKFLFQYFNFEDFLLMHFPAEIVAAWRKEAAAHFKRPWTAGEYMPKFKAFVEVHQEALKALQNYRKGDVFPLTQEHLDNLFQNNTQDGLPRSEFVTFLKDIIPGAPH